jgi:hypothetical protein
MASSKLLGGADFGPIIASNLSPSECCFHLSLIGLGSSDGYQRCSSWRGRCASCYQAKTWLQGIFCSNFAWTLGTFPPCQKVWCGECYTSDPKIQFFVRTAHDELPASEEDQFHWARLDKVWKGKHHAKNAFRVGRNGDHTMVPFECDLCIFRKLIGRNPAENSHTDALCKAAIRRVDLDAMWARSSHTVQEQRDMMWQGMRYSETARLAGPYWYDGPLPSFDHCGYEVAIQMMLKSCTRGNIPLSTQSLT